MASRRGRIVRHTGSSHPYSGGVSPRTSPVSSVVRGCTPDINTIIEVDVIQDDTAATCLSHPPPSWVVSEDSSAYCFSVRQVGLDHGDVAVKLDIQQSFQQSFRNARSSARTDQQFTRPPVKGTPPLDSLRRDSSFSSTSTSSYTPLHCRNRQSHHSHNPSNVDFRASKPSQLVVEEALLTIFCCRSSQEPAHPAGSSFNLPTDQERGTSRAWSSSTSVSLQPSSSSFNSEHDSSRTSSEASSFRGIQPEAERNGCPMCNWNEQDWRFVRRFHLPPDAAVEGTTAEVQEGVLRVQVPRMNGLSGSCGCDSSIISSGERDRRWREQWHCEEQCQGGSRGFYQENTVLEESNSTERTQWRNGSSCTCRRGNGSCSSNSSHYNRSINSDSCLEGTWLQWSVAVKQETGAADGRFHLSSFQDMWEEQGISGISTPTSRVSSKQWEPFTQQSLSGVLQTCDDGNITMQGAEEQGLPMKPLPHHTWHTQHSSMGEMEKGSNLHHQDEVMDWSSNINAPA